MTKINFGEEGDLSCSTRTNNYKTFCESYYTSLELKIINLHARKTKKVVTYNVYSRKSSKCMWCLKQLKYYAFVGL